MNAYALQPQRPDPGRIVALRGPLNKREAARNLVAQINC